MDSEEKIIFTNTFGTITDKRVIINYKSGTENIPIGQISSVGFLHERNNVSAAFGFIVGVGLLLLMFSNINHINGIAVLVLLLIAIVGFLSGIANWIGHHKIEISAAGQNRKPVQVEMSKTREGKMFADAVKRAVFK